MVWLFIKSYLYPKSQKGEKPNKPTSDSQSEFDDENDSKEYQDAPVSPIEAGPFPGPDSKKLEESLKPIIAAMLKKEI